MAAPDRGPRQDAGAVQIRKSSTGTTKIDVGNSQFYTKYGILAIQDSMEELDSPEGVKVKKVTRLYEGNSKFPKLQECAHFHYDFVELSPFKVSLCDENQENLHTIGCEVEKPEHHFYLQMKIGEKIWVIRRTYENFRTFDKQLHRCIYDRKYSHLPELRKNEVKEEGIPALKRLLGIYLDRFSAIAGNMINCGPILSWLEMDNRGNRLMVTDESAINTPAIAAAHVIKRYTAQAPDEISFEVSDIISIIDMPPAEETIWWRGKQRFEVGFFPSECVEVIGDKIPQSMDSKIPPMPVKPVLRKRGKLISLLRAFFSSRPAKTTLKRTGIMKERVFGCDLGEHLSNSEHDVPLVLKSCSQVIEAHGIVDGIYRLSGVASNIQKLRNEFDEDRVPDLMTEEYLQDIHSISSLLKMYFRELPNPLFTYQLYDKFAAAVQQEENKLSRIHDVVQQLPPPHYRTAEYLMKHLARVASHGRKTGMHCKNVAIVWAPNLLRSKELEQSCSTAALQGVGVQAIVTEFLISHAEQIFSDQMQHLSEGRTAIARRGRPKSLAISTPTKLISLEEAREQILSGAMSSPKQKYISVGAGPTNLPAYHTVLELPHKKKSRKDRKSPVGGLRALFSRSRAPSVKSKMSETDSLDTFDMPPASLPSCSALTEDDLTHRRKLRSVRSADSLFSGSRFANSMRVSTVSDGATIINPYADEFASVRPKAASLDRLRGRPKGTKRSISADYSHSESDMDTDGESGTSSTRRSLDGSSPKSAGGARPKSKQKHKSADNAQRTKLVSELEKRLSTRSNKSPPKAVSRSLSASAGSEHSTKPKPIPRSRTSEPAGESKARRHLAKKVQRSQSMGLECSEVIPCLANSSASLELTDAILMEVSDGEPDKDSTIDYQSSYLNTSLGSGLETDLRNGHYVSDNKQSDLSSSYENQNTSSEAEQYLFSKDYLHTYPSHSKVKSKKNSAKKRQEKETLRFDDMFAVELTQSPGARRKIVRNDREEFTGALNGTRVVPVSGMTEYAEMETQGVEGGGWDMASYEGTLTDEEVFQAHNMSLNTDSDSELEKREALSHADILHNHGDKSDVVSDDGISEAHYGDSRDRSARTSQSEDPASGLSSDPDLFTLISSDDKDTESFSNFLKGASYVDRYYNQSAGDNNRLSQRERVASESADSDEDGDRTKYLFDYLLNNSSSCPNNTAQYSPEPLRLTRLDKPSQSSEDGVQRISPASDSKTPTNSTPVSPLHRQFQYVNTAGEALHQDESGEINSDSDTEIIHLEDDLCSDSPTDHVSPTASIPNEDNDEFLFPSSAHIDLSETEVQYVHPRFYEMTDEMSVEDEDERSDRMMADIFSENIPVTYPSYPTSIPDSPPGGDTSEDESTTGSSDAGTPPPDTQYTEEEFHSDRILSPCDIVTSPSARAPSAQSVSAPEIGRLVIRRPIENSPEGVVQKVESARVIQPVRQMACIPAAQRERDDTEMHSQSPRAEIQPFQCDTERHGADVADVESPLDEVPDVGFAERHLVQDGYMADRSSSSSPTQGNKDGAIRSMHLGHSYPVSSKIKPSVLQQIDEASHSPIIPEPEPSISMTTLAAEADIEQSESSESSKKTNDELYLKLTSSTSDSYDEVFEPTAEMKTDESVDETQPSEKPDFSAPVKVSEQDIVIAIGTEENETPSTLDSNDRTALPFAMVSAVGRKHSRNNKPKRSVRELTSQFEHLSESPPPESEPRADSDTHTQSVGVGFSKAPTAEIDITRKPEVAVVDMSLSPSSLPRNRDDTKSFKVPAFQTPDTHASPLDKTQPDRSPAKPTTSITYQPESEAVNVKPRAKEEKATKWKSMIPKSEFSSKSPVFSKKHTTPGSSPSLLPRKTGYSPVYSRRFTPPPLYDTPVDKKVHSSLGSYQEDHPESRMRVVSDSSVFQRKGGGGNKIAEIKDPESKLPSRLSDKLKHFEQLSGSAREEGRRDSDGEIPSHGRKLSGSWKPPTREKPDSCSPKQMTNKVFGRVSDNTGELPPKPLTEKVELEQDKNERGRYSSWRSGERGKENELQKERERLDRNRKSDQGHETIQPFDGGRMVVVEDRTLAQGTRAKLKPDKPPRTLAERKKQFESGEVPTGRRTSKDDPNIGDKPGTVRSLWEQFERKSSDCESMRSRSQLSSTSSESSFIPSFSPADPLCQTGRMEKSWPVV